MFMKGEHERQIAYEAHTACDKNGIVLAVEVTAGNVNDSVAWDAVYDTVTERFPEATHIVMDAGYKTPWITKKILEDSRIPILPYMRSKFIPFPMQKRGVRLNQYRVFRQAETAVLQKNSRLSLLNAEFLAFFTVFHVACVSDTVIY